MSSFATLRKEVKLRRKRLAEYSGLDEELVDKIWAYARCLSLDRTTDIDEAIFLAQMLKQFNLTNKHTITLTYRSLRRLPAREVTLSDYCRCICTFLSSNVNLKTEFVFHVYDLNGDGELTFQELYRLTRMNMAYMDMDNEGQDEAVKELTELVMKIVGVDNSNSLNSTKFKDLVKNDILCMDILGQVLPTNTDCMRFRHKLSNLSVDQVQRMFQNERLRCLGEKTEARDSRYCTDVLDLLM